MLLWPGLAIWHDPGWEGEAVERAFDFFAIGFEGVDGTGLENHAQFLGPCAKKLAVFAIWVADPCLAIWQETGLQQPQEWFYGPFLLEEVGPQYEGEFFGWRGSPVERHDSWVAAGCGVGECVFTGEFECGQVVIGEDNIEPGRSGG